MPFTTHTFRVEVPLSLNGHTRNAPGKGRVKTPAYKTWRLSVGLQLRALRLRPLPGVYALALWLPPLRGDIDNRVKALSDVLKDAGVIVDDSRCDALFVVRTPRLQGAQAVVTLACLDGCDEHLVLLRLLAWNPLFLPLDLERAP